MNLLFCSLFYSINTFKCTREGSSPKDLKGFFFLLLFYLQLLRCSFPQAWDKYESLVWSCRCQSAWIQTVSSYLHLSQVILTNIHFFWFPRVFLPQGSVSVSRGPQKAIKNGPWSDPHHTADSYQLFHPLQTGSIYRSHHCGWKDFDPDLTLYFKLPLVQWLTTIC